MWNMWVCKHVVAVQESRMLIGGKSPERISAESCHRVTVDCHMAQENSVCTCVCIQVCVFEQNPLILNPGVISTLH